MDNKVKGEDFSIDDSTGKINIGRVYCNSINDVVKAPLLLELIKRVSREMTDIVAGRVLSDHDFTKITDIYTRVYVWNEKVLTKEEYQLLKDFLSSDKVKTYFIRLLDEDHLEMSGASKKQAALREDFLKLNGNDRVKFTPIIKHLLSHIDREKEIDEHVLLGYNFQGSYKRNSSRVSKIKRDKELQVYTHKTDEGYTLVWYRDGSVVESKSGFKSIWDSHKSGETTLFCSEKSNGFGFLGLVWNQIKEVSGFDFKKIQGLNGNSSQIAEKETGKWIIHFDWEKIIEATSFDFTKISRFDEPGTQIAEKENGKWILKFDGKNVVESTSFDFTHVEDLSEPGIQIARKKSGYGILYYDGKKITEVTDFSHKKINNTENFGIYELTADDKTFQAVQVSDSGVLSHSEKWYNKLMSAHNTTPLGEGYTLMRAQKEKLWGYLRIGDQQIESFSGSDYTDLPVFKEGIIEVAEKESGYGLVQLTSEWIKDVTGFNYKSIWEKSILNELEYYPVDWKEWRDFIYCVDGQWRETSLWIKADWLMKEWENPIVKKANKKEALLCFDKTGIHELGEREYDCIHWYENNEEYLVADIEKKQQIITRPKWGKSVFSEMVFSNVAKTSVDGLIVAQKETWYGLLKIEKWAIVEVSSFDYEEFNVHNDYWLMKLKKTSWEGYARFSKKGIEELTEFTYTNLWEFEEDNLAVAEKSTWYGMLKFVSKEVREVSSFDYTSESIEEIFGLEYGVYYMTKQGGSMGFVHSTKQWIKEVTGFDLEEIDSWEPGSKNVFYGKKQWADWAVMVQKWNTIVALSEYDFIDLPEYIWEETVDLVQKNSWWGYIALWKDSLQELSSDFNYGPDSISEISNKWKYFVTKESWWGVIEYTWDDIIELTNFDFDQEWDLSSEWPINITMGGKTHVIQNTDFGVEILADLSEYIEIDTDIREWGVSVAKKELGYGVVMMKGGQIQGISEFIYDEIEDFNEIGLAVAEKWGKVGLLYVSEWTVVEASIVEKIGKDQQKQDIDNSDDSTSFTFSDIQIRDIQTQSQGDTSMVIWDIEVWYRIFRSFEWKLFPLIDSAVQDQPYFDDNKLFPTQTEREEVRVFQDVEGGSIKNIPVQSGSKNIESISLMEWKVYQWNLKDGGVILLYFSDGKLVQQTDKTFTSVSKYGVYITWDTKDWSGMLMEKDGKIQPISEFHYVEWFHPVHNRPFVTKTTGGKNVITYSDGWKVQDIFEDTDKQVDTLHVDEEINPGDRFLFSDSDGKQGVLLVNHDTSLSIIVKPEHSVGELQMDESGVYITKWWLWRWKEYVYEKTIFWR